jgi:outer membrane protein OmpA-like peptidoglycan-associated protein
MTKLSTFAVTVAALAAGAVSLGGCATTDFVNKQVAGVNSRVDANQASISAHDAKLSGHDARLGEIGKTAQDALDRAQAAGKLAEGKFLYQTVLSDDSVKFPVRGTDLSEEAKTRLMDFVQKLKADNKNVYIEIQGHTDKTGSKDTNKRLGAERADAVRTFLNQNGIALNRIATISYGDESPVASNKTRAGRAQNRRVVMIVLN